uniref:GNAT family N-acetyltransferase n=1 Tax=Scandinavium goeteborgense TaxID=1851514 RepID=UPI001C6835CD|nr:N-acetyltransferase [Scandinavium goeteborgense]
MDIKFSLYKRENEIIIREETKQDINHIERLTLLAFTGHPHHEPGASPNEHMIINKLRDAQAMTLSLVAEDESGIVGHVAYSSVKIDGITTRWHALAPVSVSPSLQRQGIGSKMIKKSILLLKEKTLMALLFWVTQSITHVLVSIIIISSLLMEFLLNIFWHNH